MHDPRHALTGTLALLSATAAALFALALLDNGLPGDATSGQRPAPPSELDPERLLELGIERAPVVAHRVERLRDLRFNRVPKPQLSDAARLRRISERRLSKQSIRRKLAIAEAELRLLGLLAADESLGDVAADASALALAYYDPRRNELFLVGDAVPAGPQLAEFVLAHELTHALEDQHYDLTEPRGVSDDRGLAEGALVEGTASALMRDYATRHLDPLALATESAGLDVGPVELPRFAEAEIAFTYQAGARFVTALLELGGDWKLIDYAYRQRLPATTEQVLHPEKYLLDERPLPVAPPRSPGPGWRTLDTGSLGEFGTREVLDTGGLGLGADLAATGWGGDRYRLFARADRARSRCVQECRSTHALGVTWRGDDAAEARQLVRQLREYTVDALGGERREPGIWRLDGGWAAVSSAADRVGLGLAPTVQVARRIAAGGG